MPSTRRGPDTPERRLRYPPIVKRRRTAKIAWGLLLALALFFLAGDTFGTGDAIAGIARPHLYSIARWEMGNFLKKWTREFRELFPGATSQEEKIEQVRRLFDLADQTKGLRFRIQQARDGFADEPDLPGLERELAALQRRQEKLEPGVEETLESLITSTLKDAGVSSKLLLWRLLWPPVDFRLDKVPKILIVSPRDRISLMQTRLIDPDITDEDRDALEAAIDVRGLSTLVQGLGGVATYPSVIPDGSSLQRVLELAAHEWTHHYLFFHPMGRAYNATQDMTTLNETVADVVGTEIGRAVYRDHFAAPGELGPEAAPERSPPEGEAPAFDFNGAMRETRQTADRLLAEGKIEEAEAYMEERRRLFVENGHAIRKLNQAFFAFNGTYADSPASVSPIGDQLHQLQELTPDLGTFIRTISGASSYEEFLEILDAFVAEAA